MKIVFVSHTSALQGAPIALYTLAATCAAHGHACTFVSPDRGPVHARCAHAGIRTRTIARLYNASPPQAALRRLLHRLQPDVIIVNTLLSTHLLATMRQLAPRAHLLLWIHESQPDEFFAAHAHLSPDHLHTADTICVASDATRSLYARWAPEAVVLHPAVDSSLHLHPASSKASHTLRRRLGIDPSATVVVCVANFSVRKAQHELARAFARVMQTLPDRSLHLVYVSANHNSRYARDLQNLCRAQGVEHCTHMLQANTPLADVYQAADIAVLPSLVECYPLAVAEAMMAGLPVIASRTYGTQEQLTHGESGWLITPGNVSDIEHALHTIVCDPALAQQLGNAAATRAATQFDPETLYASCLALLPSQPREHMKRVGMYRVFAILKRLWILCGSPAPQSIRSLRQHLFGRIWPVQDTYPLPRHPDILPASKGTDERIAVVITSHNYGRFLSDAIDSVLRQSVQPGRILIVNDASSDDTSEKARTYAALDHRIELIEGNWRNVGQARNAALRTLTQEYQVYLDADDALHPLYLEEGIRALDAQASAAIAYPDNQFFGTITHYHRNPPAFDWRVFDRHNHINTVSMMRRTALVQAGGWYDVPNRHADWITARKMLALGWQAVHTNGVHFYRKHGNNMFDRYRKQHPYMERSGLLKLPTTLFLSLSGRAWAWPLTRAFLERQTFPHAQIHLFILDTAHDAAYSQMIRSWLGTCDYGSTTYLHRRVGRSGLPSMDRDAVRQEMRDACATIYNSFARNCHTPLALFLEDDVIPPDDAYVRLARQLTPDAVSVSAFYRHRESTRAIAWGWSSTGIPRDYDSYPTGTTPVGGTGFGCSVVRGERLRHTVFSSGLPLLNYDQNFYRSAVYDDGQRALLDWDCHCRHYSDSNTWW